MQYLRDSIAVHHRLLLVVGANVRTLRRRGAVVIEAGDGKLPCTVRMPSAGQSATFTITPYRKMMESGASSILIVVGRHGVHLDVCLLYPRGPARADTRTDDPYTISSRPS